MSLPEDAETVTAGRAGWSYSDLSDDEDFLADEASGGEQAALVAGSGGGQGGVWMLPSGPERGPKVLAQGGSSRDGLRKIGKQPKCPSAEDWMMMYLSDGSYRQLFRH